MLCANVSGVVNFAQGEFVMLGGMLAAWLYRQGIPLATRCAARDRRRCRAGRRPGTPHARAGAQDARISSRSPSRSASLWCCAASRSSVSARIRSALPGFSGDGVFFLFGAILPVQSLWVWGATAAAARRDVLCSCSYTDTGRAVRACSINLRPPA